MWFLVFSGPSADEQRILIPEAANLGSGTTELGCFGRLLGKPVGIVFLTAGYMSGFASGYRDPQG